MKEEWRDIDGYEGLYQVSTWGRVKSLKYNHQNVERLLKPLGGSKGYLHVCLWKNGQVKQVMIHRIVANAFIHNPQGLPQINHKDENKQNNEVSNLEWCTVKYNLNYGTHNQRVSQSNINNPLISKKVLQFDLEGNFIKEWKSTMEVQRQLNFKSTHICACCLKKKYHNSYKGYVWRYA